MPYAGPGAALIALRNLSAAPGAHRERKRVSPTPTLVTPHRGQGGFPCRGSAGGTGVSTCEGVHTHYHSLPPSGQGNGLHFCNGSVPVCPLHVQAP